MVILAVFLIVLKKSQTVSELVENRLLPISSIVDVIKLANFILTYRCYHGTSNLDLPGVTRGVEADNCLAGLDGVGEVEDFAGIGIDVYEVDAEDGSGVVLAQAASELTEFVLLVRPNPFDRVAEVTGTAGFHFDNHDCHPVFRQNINLTHRIPLIPLKYPVSNRLQKLRRPIFARSADCSSIHACSVARSVTLGNLKSRWGCQRLSEEA